MAGQNKSVYTSDQCGRTNAWVWDPRNIIIVGVDVEVTEDNKHLFCSRPLKDAEELAGAIYGYGGVHTPPTITKVDGTAYCVTGRCRILGSRIAIERAEASGDTLKAAALSRLMCKQSTAKTKRELFAEVMMENDHRRAIPPRARAANMANARYFGMNNEEIAEVSNCSTELVRNLLQIHDSLIDEAKDKLDTGELTLDAALDMARHMKAAEQRKSLKEIVSAPKGKKRSAVQKASGRAVTKAPKLRIVKVVAASTELTEQQREAILWARGVLRDSEVSFSDAIKEAEKEKAKSKQSKKKPEKKDKRQQQLPGTEE